MWIGHSGTAATDECCGSIYCLDFAKTIQSLAGQSIRNNSSCSHAQPYIASTAAALAMAAARTHSRTLAHAQYWH